MSDAKQMDHLEKLNKILELMQNDTVKPSEIEAFLQAVLEFITKSKTSFDTLSAENLQEISAALLTIQTEHSDILSEIDARNSQLSGKVESKMAELRKAIDSVMASKPKDGNPGKDGVNPTPESVVPLVLEKLPKPIEETGETIADKLETLKGDKRLDASAIKNLPDFKEGKSQGSGLRNVFHDTTLTGTGRPEDPLKVTSSGGTVGPGTINELAYFDTTTSIASLAVATYPSLTEISYVKGVTSAIQTQINAKFTLPSLTAGSVLFSNGSTIAQDNANFFWDDTNNRLGIGTSTPGTINGTSFSTLGLHVKGTGASKYIVVDDNEQVGVLLNDSSQSANSRLWGFNNEATQFGIATFTDAGSATKRLVIKRSGEVGIGTASPTSDLHVQKSVNDVVSLKVYNTSAGDSAYSSMFFGESDSQNITINYLNSGVPAGFGGTATNNPNTGYVVANTGATGGLVIRTNANAPIIFATGGTGADSQRMTILGTGNVGIGNITPGALLDIGLAGTTLGTLRLEGNTSGYVQIQPAAAAGSWTFTLPADDGTNGQVLTTNGSGVTSWTTVSGGGGIATVSIASANGFAGTSDADPTDPTLTISTSITGVLKGNGTAISAATDGTDYLSSTTGITVSQGSSQSIGDTTHRLTKLWATDITVTNAITGSVTGNAGTATALQNARTIGGVSFDGTANITVATATGGFTVSGGDLALGANNLTMTGSLGATGARLTKGWFTDLQVTNAISGDITGNAATASAVAVGGITGLAAGIATFLATPSSANLISAVTDETGTGFLVFATSPTISTPRISQVMGGTAAGSNLNLQATTNASASGEAIVFKVGNNGATEAMRITGATVGANLKIAGTATRGTTEGTNHIDIFNGTAPVGTLTNGISIYSASGIPTVMDASGNANGLGTTSSPTFAGLALGSGNLTLTGSVAATGSRVTKGWFTDIESTNMPTVGGTAILTSLTAPQFTTIELGAASDTTLSRVSAGVIAVEGVNVLLNGGALGTPSSGTGTNITGITAAHVVAGTFGTGAYTMDTSLTVPQVINTNNAITASGNAATVPITSRISTVTNNSAATLTITITTTSAVDGQLVVVRILDFSAAVQTITWVNTENSTVAAPSASNGSTTLPLTVGFQYNSNTSKWRCIASA